MELLAQLLLGPDLQLPRALAGEPEVLAQLLERQRMIAHHPLLDDVPLARVELLQRLGHAAGDQLIIEVELLWYKGDYGKIRAVATVDGEAAATMEATFKLVDGA